MAQETHSQGFAPKDPPRLNPPQDTPISLPHLAKCDGLNPSYPTYVAIKGTVFDVSGNTAYAPKGSYHVFAGKDPSRALALSSLKEEDCRPDWEDLSDKEKQVLSDWVHCAITKDGVVRIHSGTLTDTGVVIQSHKIRNNHRIEATFQQSSYTLI